MLYEHNLRGAGSSGFTQEILNSRIAEHVATPRSYFYIGICYPRVDRAKV